MQHYHNQSEYMWMFLDNKDFSVGGAARVIETKKKIPSLRFRQTYYIKETIFHIILW